MKKVLTIVAALAVLALAVSLAGAAPRLDAGSTGLVQTPTANILGEGMFDLAVGYIDQEDYTAYPARFVYGLGKAELGIAYAKLNDGVMDPTVLQYSGKLQLMPETNTQPAVAFGADYLDLQDFGPPGGLNRWSIYAVATKQLTTGNDGPSVRGNLGVAYERWGWEGNAESDVIPFVGLEVMLAKSTSVLAEYKWEGDIDLSPKFSAAVRHSFAPNLMVEAGITDLLGLEGDARFFAGLSYRWGAGY